MNKTATFIKKLDGSQGPNYAGGDVRLYRLSDPIPFWDYGPNTTSTLPAGETTVVAVVVHGTSDDSRGFTPSTLVVPADASGNENIDDQAFCIELRGWLSHEKALNFLGFDSVIGGTEEVDPDQILSMANNMARNSADFSPANLPPELAALLDSIDDNIDEDDDETEQGTGTTD